MTTPPVFIAADHGGFSLKQQLIEQLTVKGYQLQDMGAPSLQPDDDYPMYGAKLAQQVAATPHARGVAICRSGHGMVITANKIKGVRASLATPDAAWNRQGVEHDNVNVLAIGADYLAPQTILPLVLDWLTASYQGLQDTRHQRRLRQISDLESPLQVTPVAPL